MANFNRTDLKANNALLINDNSSEDITPEDVRDALNNNSDSSVNRLTDPYFKYLGTTAGTTTAYTLTNSTDYPGDAYNNTVYFALEFNANNGANPTLNINSLGAKDIYLNTTTQVTAADTLEAGSRYIAVYNSSLDAILLVLVFNSLGQTSPGGSNGDIQINDAGSFGATSDITISSGDVSIPNGDLTVGTSQTGVSSISVGSADATKDTWKLESTETGGEALLDISDSSLAKVVIRLNGDQGDVSIPNGNLSVTDGNLEVGLSQTGASSISIGSADATKDTFSIGCTDSGGAPILQITNADSASVMGKFNGDTGALQLDQYGSGTITGTTAYLLAVDSSGNVIEDSVGITQTEGTYTATASTSSSGITLGSLSRLEYTKTGDLYTVSGLISITTTTTGQKTFTINPTSVLPNIPEQAMTGSVADRSGNIDFGQLVDNTPTGGSDIISITINVASTGSSAIQWMYTYNSAK